MKPGDEGYVNPLDSRADRNPSPQDTAGTSSRAKHAQAVAAAGEQPTLMGVSRSQAAPQPSDTGLYEGGPGRVHGTEQPRPDHRRRMPIERASLTHKVMIAGQEGYFTAGFHEDGSLGELFVSGFGKEGSTQVGWINSWAIAVSHALQYGASLRSLARKYHLMKFEPNGPTDNPQIPECLSVPDYVFRWLVSHFGDEELKKEIL